MVDNFQQTQSSPPPPAAPQNCLFDKENLKNLTNTSWKPNGHFPTLLSHYSHIKHLDTITYAHFSSVQG